MAGESQRLINVITDKIDSSVKDGATETRTPGVIISSSGSGYEASAYIRGDDVIDDLIIPNGMAVSAGDYVFIAEDGEDKSWIDRLIPATLYSKLAIDYERRQILSGDGTADPVAVIEFNDDGEMVDPSTGNSVGGTPASKVYVFNNFQ